MDKSKKFQANNSRFQERMLLIFIIGGIIPFLIATIYMNSTATKVVHRQNKQFQTRELDLVCSVVEQAVGDMREVSQKVYANKTLQTIMERDNISDEQWKQYDEKLKEIAEYQKYYASTISDIAVYVDDEELSYHRPFAYAGSSVIDARWYINAGESEGELYWCYGVDREGKQNCIQLSRKFVDERGNQLGILVVRMNMDWLNNYISKQKDDTVLLYNDSETIFTNYSVTTEEQYSLFAQLNAKSNDTGSLRYNKQGEDVQLSYGRVRPIATARNYFTIACSQDYSALSGSINRATLTVYFVVGIGLLISLTMIMVYSSSFSRRLKKLRKQMHLVANGQYDKVEAIDGTDEIAEIYQELVQMMEDIQKLTTGIVEEKVQKEKMHTRQKEVEFKMLASQINPHFLYNTLETIRMKARVSKQSEIEDLVKMLAKIMRRNIQVSHQMVSLKSEIELIENYLKIQSYRFGDRIRSEVIVEDNVHVEQNVMPLIIQPFVENAFVHGLEGMVEDGKLTVHVSQNEKDIIIEVIDNGVGMKYYQLAELRRALEEENHEQTHIGIKNVNQRLIIQYGPDYAIHIESEEGRGTKVTFRIPLDTDEEESI